MIVICCSSVIVLLYALFGSEVLLRQKSDKKCAADISLALKRGEYRIPDGTPWQDKRVLRFVSPQGYNAGVAWITATTAVPCVLENTTATINIDWLRVIGVDSAGNEKVVYEENFDSGTTNTLNGGLYTRFPSWFAGDKHTPMHVNNKDGYLYIDVARAPQKVFHLWTPRFAVEHGVRYITEASVRVEGYAYIQFGFDFWRDFSAVNNGFDEFCRGTNNCEAYVGGWIGNTHDTFVHVRLP